LIDRHKQTRPDADGPLEPTLTDPAQETEAAAAVEALPGTDSTARWVPGLRAEVPVDWVLPQLGVRDRRQMFNRAAAGSIWITAAACAFAGRSMVGVAGSTVGGVLGLLLADRASANIASSAEEDVMSDRGCHGCARGSPGRFF
jgi:hypothetical protein